MRKKTIRNKFSQRKESWSFSKNERIDFVRSQFDKLIKKNLQIPINTVQL